MKKRIFLFSFIALTLFAVNAKSDNFKQWALTPPMGWNSWDCYGPTVTETEVKEAADYMSVNLKQFGWKYIVVDIRWYVDNTTAGGYNEKDPIFNLDKWGRYTPSVKRFPSAADGKGFKILADYIHSKGLKFGIHIMRGIPKKAVESNSPILGTNGITASQICNKSNLCKWLHDNLTVDATKQGAQEYYNSIFDLYASWGVDFIKIDDMSAPFYHQDEIDMVRNAIDQCGRNIVLSLSPGETPIANASHVSTHANMWRMVNDVWDQWGDVKHLVNVCSKWYPYISPGTWPDCDMIPLGHISIRGERGGDRMTRLTKNEQYTLMTLFSIFRSPLMFGGDLPTLDKFTKSLLTNREVLNMHNHSTGVHQIFNSDDKVAITSRGTNNGAIYLALLNMSDNDNVSISVDYKLLKLKKKDVKVIDMWTGKSVINRKSSITRILPKHASVLLKLK
jgi:alpha-galactosidase